MAQTALDRVFSRTQDPARANEAVWAPAWSKDTTVRLGISQCR